MKSIWGAIVAVGGILGVIAGLIGNWTSIYNFFFPSPPAAGIQISYSPRSEAVYRPPKSARYTVIIQISKNKGTPLTGCHVIIAWDTQDPDASPGNFVSKDFSIDASRELIDREVIFRASSDLEDSPGTASVECDHGIQSRTIGFTFPTIGT